MTIGREIIRLGRVSSTMDVLDEYARAGVPEGLVVLADEQTAGRGRAGRAWTDEPGHSLLASVLVRPSVAPARLGTLPIVAGIAVAETIERFTGPRCRLKWPNDVLIGDRKVAGILMQSRIAGSIVDFVNIGIGINVGAPRLSLPDGATSIEAEGGNADSTAVLPVLLERMNEAYADYERSGGRPDLAKWRSRAALLGETVTVVSSGISITGVFEDIDDSGAILLRTDPKTVVALGDGEVERGPRRPLD